MKKYSFVRYTGNYTRGESKISIQKSGLIRLSPRFCETASIRSFSHVVLFFDITNKTIAFKFTNDKEEGVLALTKDRSAATIAGKTFMKANNLERRSYYRRYEWEQIIDPEIGKVYIIKLT